MVRDESNQALPEPLSERELEVLSLLAVGKSNREIAGELVLSLNTVKWYARQIYGKLGVGDRQEAAQQALALGLLRERGEALPPHNLPAQLTPFVGRQDELATLAELLAEPGTRLITIAGPGGIGKTRLALQAATAYLHGHPEPVRDGIYFLSLVEVEDVQGLAELLNQTLGLPPVEGEMDAHARLLGYLHQKKTLLVLDNAEQLAGQELAAFLAQLLTTAPGVMVLATSRRRLGVHGEQLLWLDGLQVPTSGLDQSAGDLQRLLRSSSALALFLQTARRLHPAFVPTSESAIFLIQICQAVEGMPLGIELAAAWMGLLTPEELLDQLGSNLDILTTEAGNVPNAQRSLRAVFDTSWKLLTPAEQQAVRALSLFRGGFTRQAAQEIGDIALPTLLALRDKCWLQQEAGGRFAIHEVLRQHGAEALAATPEQWALIRRRHSAYYCQWLAEQQEAIVGRQQRQTLAALERELGNIRIACSAAIEMGQAGSLRQALPTLGLFYRSQGRYRAGDTLFESLLRALADQTERSPAADLLRARLLVWRAELRSLVGDDQGSMALAEEAAALADQLEAAGQQMAYERTYIARERAYDSLLRTQSRQEALRHFSEAYAMARQVGSWWEVAQALMGLARARRNLGQLAEAEEAVTGASTLFREKGNAPAVAEAVTLHGNIVTRLGRLQEAVDRLQGDLQLTVPNPYVEGYRLFNLAWAHFLLGQFEQAEALSMKGIEKYRENEIWAIMVPWLAIVGEIRYHRGHYAAAEKTVAEMTPLVPPANQTAALAVVAQLHGIRALAEEKWHAAGEYLQRSLASYRLSPDWHSIGANGCLALVARRVEPDTEAARHYLLAELRATTATTLPSIPLSLLVGALLLADRGEIERAMAIKARVFQEPFARNSVWLYDVAGRELEQLGAQLSPSAREAAAQRGHGLDLQQTAAALLNELAPSG